ncbi:cytidylyltransferase domain-containing protein [Jeotgalibacillus terrae]|uniref:Cytidylyltransferase domain-containing protein n=1 Tax=Jeotgalibacillus terrae TaxID=587735 RepID=A0ABW5ZCY1_9BACL|nr:spore coat polysaccharide biosynthesis protein SpsF [Jeotgalibacillus terrae]
MKVAAIIQARMGSTRLPGKVMKELMGKTILSHVIARVSQANTIDEIIIATPNKNNDDVISNEAKKCGVKVYRGSEKDVLSRYYYAAKESEVTTIVRITSDCPLIDPHVIDEVVNYYKNGNNSIVTNAGTDPTNRTFPRGLDTEVFSFKVLEEAYHLGKENYHREHVTPYIYENADKVYLFKNNIDYSKYRWTLDTAGDFELISEIYDELYKGKHDFFLKEIIELFEQKPELIDINAHVEQKEIN